MSVKSNYFKLSENDFNEYLYDLKKSSKQSSFFEKVFK